MASTNITTFPGKVGISNANPTHTLSIGSNVFVDDTGTNKLVVLGSISTTGTLSGDGSGISNIQSSNVSDFASNVTRIGTLETDLDDNSSRISTVSTDLSDNSSRISSVESGTHTFTGTKTFQDDVILESNLRVQGDLLVANTVNMTVSDPILELGSNNLNTGDIGLVMTRHGASNSNVAVFFDESEDVLKLGYTLNGAGDSTLEFDSNALAVSIQGTLEVDTANVNTMNVSAIEGLQTLSFSSDSTTVPPLQLTADSLNDGVGALRIDSVEPDIFLNDTDGGFSTVTFANNDVARAAFGRNNGDDFYITVRDPATNGGNWRDTTLVVDSSSGNVSMAYGLTVGSNLGIGTTNPLDKLMVMNGTIRSHDAGNTINIPGLKIRRRPATEGQTGSNYIECGQFNDVGNEGSGTDGNKFVITNSGNVGIGTTNPQGLLHISSGTSGDAHLILEADTDNNNESDNPKIVFRQDGGYYTGEIGLVSNQVVFRNKTGVNGGFIFYSNVSSGTVSKTDLDHLEDTQLEVMRIEGLGNVGIGTTNPGAKLDVFSSSTDPGAVPTLHVGDGAIDYGDYGMLQLTRSPSAGGSKAHAAFIRSGNTVFSMGYYNNTNTFGLWPSFSTVTNTPAMAFATGGNVGIGTTNPGVKLELEATNPKIRLTDNRLNTATDGLELGAIEWFSREASLPNDYDPVAKIAVHVSDTSVAPDGEIRFSTGINGTLTERLILMANGNVGIGTPSPSSRLHVNLGNASGEQHIRATQTSLVSSTAGIRFGDSTWDAFIDHSHGSKDLMNFGFYRNPTRQVNMVLTHEGNVGIGTTSPGAKLDVVTSSTTPALWLRNSTNGSGCVINMTDTTNSAQFGTLTYLHQDGSSLGAANRLHFSTNQATSVFSTEGTLMIGVNGKDNGYMTNTTGSGRKNLWIQSTYNGNTSQNYGWWIGGQNQGLSSGDNDLYFGVVRNGTITVPALIQDATAQSQMNFTGQHRTFVKGVPIQQLEDKEGLIVSADQNDFIRMSGGIARGNEAITTNESLPVVSFSTKSNDKKCFGVISTTEDPENRVEVYGNFKSNMHKELGDTRVYINSVGEGAVWVTDINGPLESGDYITTSNVTGYGMRQEDDILHNYTVAKITMDCDFNPRTQPKKIIKKELANVDYWIDYATSEIKQEEYETLPENEREIREDKYYKIYKREIQKTNPENDNFVHEVHEELVNVLDEHGQLQWEDDPSGATEKAYKIRYLDTSGQITDEANAVHIAAFVGCTYHCG
jgi:hypothetical protein